MYATQELRDEHEGIQVMLAVLERLAGELRQGRGVRLDDLERILDFLRTFADKCHHGKEEDELFPALAAAGIPTQGGPIGVMLHEHTEGRAHIRGMGEALERLRAGEAAGEDFARHALAYVALLRAHIDKENHVLFVIAEQRLAPDVHAQLRQAFARIEEERIGAGTHERYHALIRELRNRYLEKAA